MLLLVSLAPRKAAEIVGVLGDAGIKHVAFKPGSVDGIRQVAAIAATNPDYPIIYGLAATIRTKTSTSLLLPHMAPFDPILTSPSLALVTARVWPCITGEWTLEYSVQPMPFDGVLFGSWAVVAGGGAHTGGSVKQLLVRLPASTMTSGNRPTREKRVASSPCGLNSANPFTRL